MWTFTKQMSTHKVECVNFRALECGERSADLSPQGSQAQGGVQRAQGNHSQSRRDTFTRRRHSGDFSLHMSQ
jgi:hypothetical protein